MNNSNVSSKLFRATYSRDVTSRSRDVLCYSVTGFSQPPIHRLSCRIIPSKAKRPFTRQKNLGPDPSKKRYGLITFVKKHWSFCRARKAVYTTEKFGPDPPKKAVRTHTFCKETLEFLQGHRRLWPCRNSTVSLQKL